MNYALDIQTVADKMTGEGRMPADLNLHGVQFHSY